MKKTIALVSSLLIAGSAFAMSAYAEDDTSVTAYVTIADANGELALVQEPITVTDIDEDGALTINDALYIAHEENYEGGAEAGYAASVTQYGLGLDKLWGTQNGGSYGYYVNNTAASGLADALSDGDYVNAFVYTDLTAWSDSYSFFDKNTADVTQGDELTLTLSRAAYDENWAPVTLPVEGAVISINGEDTEYVTDADGNVTVKIETAGENLISASSDSLTLVPPVCVVNAAEDPESTTTTTTAVITTTRIITEPILTTTTTTTSTAATTTTTKPADNSPKTGDKGMGLLAVAAGVFAVTAAFTLRRRNDED